ncbi:unnamed protein product [Arctogadus glacialis]
MEATRIQWQQSRSPGCSPAAACMCVRRHRGRGGVIPGSSDGEEGGVGETLHEFEVCDAVSPATAPGGGGHVVGSEGCEVQGDVTGSQGNQTCSAQVCDGSQHSLIEATPGVAGSAGWHAFKRRRRSRAGERAPEDHWGVELLDQSSHNKQIRNREGSARPPRPTQMASQWAADPWLLPGSSRRHGH